MTALPSPIAEPKLIGVPLTATGQAMFDTAKGLRRLSWRYRREAQKWEAQGNYRFYAECASEARRLWRDARWYLQHARMNRIMS